MTLKKGERQMKKLLYSILALPVLIASSSALCYAAVPIEVPEPTTGLLVLMGVAGITAYKRFRNGGK